MTAAGRPRHDGLSIGAVFEQLRPDFPNVTISKIRFLESEGLVRPARTPSGYRQFTSEDVERLRFVLRAQRDHYLPLKVIKAQLDDADRPARSVPISISSWSSRAMAPVTTSTLSAPDDAVGPDKAQLTRDDLLAAADVGAGMLVELERYGLVRPTSAGFYHSEAVEVAGTVMAMTEFGIEPQHLRTVRASADREVDLVEQVVAPMYGADGCVSHTKADEAIRQLAALTIALHTLLVRAGVRRVTGT